MAESSNEANPAGDAQVPTFIFALVLFAGILITYASAFFEHYFFADEFTLLSPTTGSQSLSQAAISLTEQSGRPFLGVFHQLQTYLYLWGGEHGLLLIRVVQALASTGFAVASFLTLARMGLPRIHALVLCLFIWMQPALAVYHGYTALASIWPACLAALAVFHLLYLNAREPTDWLRVLACVVFLVFSLLTYQMAFFVCCGFLALAVLRDQQGEKYRLAVLITVLLCVIFVSYALGIQLLRAFTSLFDYYNRFDNGVTFAFLLPFEFWSYPPGIEITERTRSILILLAAMGFSLLLLGAFVREQRRDPNSWKRWGLAMFLLGMTFIPIMADGSGRQHAFLAATMAMTMVACYALNVLFGHLLHKRWAWLMLPVMLVVMSLAGTSFFRGMVEPAARVYEFARESIEQYDGEQVEVLHLVLPVGVWTRDLCVYEPCAGFYRRRFQGAGHMTWKGLYENAIRDSGRSWNLDVRQYQEDLVPDGEAKINWWEFLERENCAGRMRVQGMDCSAAGE